MTLRRRFAATFTAGIILAKSSPCLRSEKHDTCCQNRLRSHKRPQPLLRWEQRF